MEKSQHEGRQVQQQDGAGSTDHDGPKPLRDLNQAGGVGQQQRRHDAEGQADRLNGDARIAFLQHCRYAADRQALAGRVRYRQHRGQRRLEADDQAERQPTDEANQYRRRNDGRIAAAKELRPRPQRRDQQHQQQQERFVDRTLQRHRLAGDGDARQAGEGLVVEARVAGAGEPVLDVHRCSLSAVSASCVYRVRSSRRQNDCVSTRSSRSPPRRRRCAHRYSAVPRRRVPCPRRISDCRRRAR